MSTFPNVTKLSLGPILTTSKGSKQIAITNDGAPLLWSPSEYLEIPFEPSNFSDKESSRQSICFSPTPEIESFQSLFQSWCIKTLAKKSKELLGSEQTEAQIKEKFQPCVKMSEKGWSTFRAKMNIAGKNAVQCWTHEKVKRSPPSCWKDCKILPQFHIKSLYLMNKEIGPILDVRHCLVEDIEPQCPFE